MLSLTHIGPAASFGVLLVSWLVGGCGARAVSCKTPIFFVNIFFKMFFLGWLTSLLWSVSKSKYSTQTNVNSPSWVNWGTSKKGRTQNLVSYYLNRTLFTVLDKCRRGIEHWNLVIERASIAVLGGYFCSLTSVLFIALMNYWAVSFIGVYCPPQCHIWAALQRLSSRLNEDQWPDKTKMEMAL